MPVAFVTVLVAEWLMRADGPPAPPVTERALDTRIEAFADPRPAAGTVVIAPPAEAGRPDPDGLLAASPQALAEVRDVAFFRLADHPAWGEIAARLRSEAAAARPPAPDASLGELLGMPKSFRGRPVRMQGTLRRLEQLEPPAGAAEAGRYWQGWLEPAQGAVAPVIVHLLDLPPGMPTGLTIREPVIIDGYFLKAAAYRAADGVRVAPLILAAAPIRPARGPAVEGGGFGSRSLGLLATGTLLALVVALGYGVLAGGRRQRPRSAPSDLDATLAGFSPETTTELLRRVAASDRSHPDGDTP